MNHKIIYVFQICLIFYLFQSSLSASIEGNEPTCLSRFDYDYKMLLKMVDLELKQGLLEETIKQQRKELTEKMDTSISLLTEERENQKRQVQQFAEQLKEKVQATKTQTHSETGATFIRWGRTSCPGNGTELVYHGYTGGSMYDKSGGAAEYLCLPRDPIWGYYEDQVQSSSAGVYGAEYELDQRTLSNFFKSNMRHHYDDAPCAVCRTIRSGTHMIPGRNQCYDGWTTEYYGYLVAGFIGHAAATEFVCLDVEPEILTGGKHADNNNGKLFFFAEAICGSLPCPPYVNGRELTCAVCSK